MSVQVTLSGVPVQVAHRFVCTFCDRCCKTRQALVSYIRNLHAAEHTIDQLPPGATIDKLLKTHDDAPVAAHDDEPEETPEPPLKKRTLRRGSDHRDRLSAKAKLDALAAWEGAQSLGAAPCTGDRLPDDPRRSQRHFFLHPTKSPSF